MNPLTKTIIYSTICATAMSLTNCSSHKTITGNATIHSYEQTENMYKQITLSFEKSTYKRFTIEFSQGISNDSLVNLLTNQPVTLEVNKQDYYRNPERIRSTIKTNKN
jgi:hypothetical protein